MFSEFDVKKIIVPTDFSESAYVAMDHAVDVAKQFGAEVTLLHIIETSAYSGILSSGSSLNETEKELAQQKIQEDANKLQEDSGVKVSHVVARGRIYEGIVNISQEMDTDLIIMGTHGVSGWVEFFVGSNAFKVVTQSPCPILTIQENAKAVGYKNVILPIDGSRETRQKVRYAVALAKVYGAAIHIGALVADDVPEVRFDFEKKTKQITDYLERENIEYTVTTLTGSNFATMTMNFAESKGGDLIVMMTEQESNMTGFLMGAFAQQVVNHSRIPVLSISAVEGEGFSFT